MAGVEGDMNTWTLLDDPPDAPREDRLEQGRREYMESHFRRLWVWLGEIEEEDEIEQTIWAKA